MLLPRERLPPTPLRYREFWIGLLLNLLRVYVVFLGCLGFIADLFVLMRV